MKNKLLLIIPFVFGISLSNAQNNYNLLLKSGTFEPKTMGSQNFLEIDQNEINATDVYRIIQFDAIPTNADKSKISESGIQLLEYIPNFAYLAKIPKPINYSDLKSINVRTVYKLSSIQKLHKQLVSTPYPKWIEDGKNIKVAISTFTSADIDLLISELEKSKSKVLNTNHITINSIEASIPKNELNNIANLAFVKNIEPVAPPSEKEDDRGKSLHRSSAINTNTSAGRKYDGTGVTVSLADDGAIGPHIDFEGRLEHKDNVASYGSHGDMTAGILCGAGNLDPTIGGMAPGAQLKYYDIGSYPQVVDAVSNYTNDNTVLSSTSYSQGTGGVYTTSTRFIDQQLNQNNQLMHIFSAGNDGFNDHGYGAGSGWGNITGGYKAGKNVIACGNLNFLDVLEGSSSRGPADDGRIKPDICANGINQLSTDENNTYQVGGGTSAAAPGVAGITTQLYHAYRENNGGANPDAGLLKACMLNTAEDLGNPGPDFQHGWGRVNALKAAKMIEDQRYFVDTISQGENNVHTVTVPSNVYQLRIMTYWTDVEGSTVASKSLVNDINMEVTAPGNTTYQPWVLDPTPNATNLNADAVRGIDGLNNVEQVTINNPVSGIYTVDLNGFSIPSGPQKYFVLYEFIYDDIEVTYPIGGESFSPSTQEFIRWDAGSDAGTFSLEYSYNGGSSWSTISNSIPGDQRHYQFNVPAFLTGEAMLRISRGVNSDTNDDFFYVVRTPTNFHIESVCPDTITLDWNNVTGVNQFEVSMLGDMYMDSIGRSSSSIIEIAGLDPQEEHWFSVKAIGPDGSESKRAEAILQTPGISNCILNRDLEISSIVSPSVGQFPNCLGFTNSEIVLEVKNSGAANISTIDLSYQVNNGSINTESFTVNLNPDGTSTVTFANTSDFSTAGAYNISVWSNWTQDQDPTNDTITQEFEIYNSTLETLPYEENFDNFTSCNTISSCEFGTCDLEGGWMNLTNSVYDDIDWRTDAGGTPTPNTGPSSDFSSEGTGNYLYVEVPSNCYGKVAEAITPCFDLTSQSAAYLSFAMHLKGNGIGKVHYDVVTNTGTIESVPPVFNREMGDDWVDTTFDLSEYAGQIVAVKFRGTSGNTQLGDMALDGVKMSASPASTSENVNSKFEIIPNPSNGVFVINLNYKNEVNQILITNALGQQIKSLNKVEKTNQVDISDFPKGIYNVIIKADNSSENRKIVVQ